MRCYHVHIRQLGNIKERPIEQFDIERGRGDMIPRKATSPYRKLKSFMVENDISNTAAAKVIGVKPNTFSKKLNRINTDFTLQEMRTLCITYDLDANVFFLH